MLTQDASHSPITHTYVQCIKRHRHLEGFIPHQTKSLRAAVQVASGLRLDFDRLKALCEAIASDRPFDLVVNNCQAFCTEVLVELVRNGTITRAEFDALATKGFTPIVRRRVLM
jgi:hypothetical protein